MKVEVISREVIKPSASLPGRPEKLRLSSLDQLPTSDYVGFWLMYPCNGNDIQSSPQVKSDDLKKSLSKTLTHFYHIAGRIKEPSQIDCSDQGVEFIETRVNCRLMELLQQDKYAERDQLLPCETSVTAAELVTKSLLPIQFNVFDCGGVAIGLCYGHKLGDGASLASFLNCWAKMTRGVTQTIPNVYFNLSSDFPFKDSPYVASPSTVGIPREPNFVMKPFVFDASSIAALRAFGRSCKVQNPTRVELVTAFLWWRAMALGRRKKKSRKAYVAISAVNLRRRMVPPLPNHAFGNIATPTITQIVTEEMEVMYHELVCYISDSFKKIDGSYVKKLQCGNEVFLNCLQDARQDKSVDELVTFNFTSVCRFPFYEIDFGWGAPSRIGFSKRPGFLFMLADTKSGDGIEAWVNMSEEDMAQFEQDREFLSFASIKSVHSQLRGKI